MIPVAAIVELIPLITGTVRLIRGLLPDEEQQQLVRWAKLLKEKPNVGESSEEWQRDVGQFLVDLTTKRGYSPAYQYEQAIAVPDDMLTDLVDLLVGGWSAGSKWNVRSLLRDPIKDRLLWQEIITDGIDSHILEEATNWLAKRGRSRTYSSTPATRVDKDWFADSISYLIG